MYISPYFTVLRALGVSNSLKELTKTDSIFYPLFLHGLYAAVGTYIFMIFEIIIILPAMTVMRCCNLY